MPQDAENRGDIPAVAHRSQLGYQRDSFAGRASAAACRGEEPSLGLLLRENEILLSLLESVRAVTVVAAREDVDLGNLRPRKPFVDAEMVASEPRCNDVDLGSGGIGWIAGLGRGVGLILNRCDRAEKHDIALL